MEKAKKPNFAVNMHRQRRRATNGSIVNQKIIIYRRIENANVRRGSNSALGTNRERLYIESANGARNGCVATLLY